MSCSKSYIRPPKIKISQDLQGLGADLVKKKRAAKGRDGHGRMSWMGGKD